MQISPISIPDDQAWRGGAVARLNASLERDAAFPPRDANIICGIRPFAFSCRWRELPLALRLIRQFR